MRNKAGARRTLVSTIDTRILRPSSHEKPPKDANANLVSRQRPHLRPSGLLRIETQRRVRASRKRQAQTRRERRTVGDDAPGRLHSNFLSEAAETAASVKQYEPRRQCQQKAPKTKTFTIPAHHLSPRVRETIDKIGECCQMRRQ